MNNNVYKKLSRCDELLLGKLTFKTLTVHYLRINIDKDSTFSKANYTFTHNNYTHFEDEKLALVNIIV